MSCWIVAARRMSRCGQTWRISARPSPLEPAGWKRKDLKFLFPMGRSFRATQPESGVGLQGVASMLEVTVDKFKFKVPEALLFSDAGIWVALEGSRVRLGLSDFAQQVNGDIAFANVEPGGTVLQTGDEFGSIETVKVNVGLPSPVAGRIVEVNALLQDSPEVINQDPYGKGWMVVLELNDWQSMQALLDAPHYLELVKRQAEAELKK